MTDFRSSRRSLLALAVAACIAIADRCLGAVYDFGAYALNAACSTAAKVFAWVVRLAPARVDVLLPLERVKLTAAEARAMRTAKRERPLIFAQWRMNPST